MENSHQNQEAKHIHLPAPILLYAGWKDLRLTHSSSLSEFYSANQLGKLLGCFIDYAGSKAYFDYCLCACSNSYVKITK